MTRKEFFKALENNYTNNTVYRASTCKRCNESIASKDNALKLADANGNNQFFICRHCLDDIKKGLTLTSSSKMLGKNVKNRTHTILNMFCNYSLQNLHYIIKNNIPCNMLDNNIHIHMENVQHHNIKARCYNDLQGVSDFNYTVFCGCGCGYSQTITDYKQTMPSITHSKAYSIKMHR